MQHLINPETHERFIASDSNAELLRDQGWPDARPAPSKPQTDFGRSGIIVQGLRATDYNAASVERIYAFIQSGDAEYAQGILDYERAHQNRALVIKLAEDRLNELGADDEHSDQGGDEPADYESWKQPKLKAELKERGIEFPGGAVSNATLVDLLKADDESKKGEANANG